VPGANLVFLTFAAALAYRARHPPHHRWHVRDRLSGYPDCRDETIKALNAALNSA